MNFGFLTSGIQISVRRFLAVILLFSPSFAWFYAINSIVFEHGPGVTPPSEGWILTGKALFLIAIALSAIIGSMICKRWKCNRFLSFWVLFGVLTTIAFAVFKGPTVSLLLSALAGISFGIGFPSCLAFIADSTAVEERARVSGFTMLITFISIPVVGGVLNAVSVQLGLTAAFFVLAAFRATSFFALFTETCEISPPKIKTWSTVFTTRGFGLYLLSWLMYMAASSTVVFVSNWLPDVPKPQITDLENIALALQSLGVAFAALLSGFAADRFGRKNVITFGLASLGIAYMAYGLTRDPIAYLFAQLFFGASYGIMFSVFFITVIGDFGSIGSRERYYAAGSIFLFAYFASQLLSGMFIIEDATVVAFLLGMALFVAILPIQNAPETLPREKIRSRRFREHLKKVRELVEEEESRNNH